MATTRHNGVPIGGRIDRIGSPIPVAGVPGDPLDTVIVASVGGNDPGPGPRDPRLSRLGRGGGARRGARAAAALMDEIESYLKEQPQDPEPTPACTKDGSRLTLLLPYSGSPGARRVMDVAARIAQMTPVDVRIVHVRCYEVCRGARFFTSRAQDAVLLVRDAIVRFRVEGVAASGVVRSASCSAVAEAIVEEASASHASLVVMGVHRRRVLADAFGRHVVRQVVRDVACPVLCVRTDMPRDVRSGTGGAHRPGPASRVS